MEITLPNARYRLSGPCAAVNSTTLHCPGIFSNPSSGNTGSTNFAVTQQCVTGVCGSPEGTEIEVGLSGTNAPDTICQNKCTYRRTYGIMFPSLGGGGGGYQSTGASCGATTSGLGSPTGGGEYSEDTQCGTFNGERICVASLSNGQCARTSGGQGVCVTGLFDNTQSPQAPNAGVPNLPASADMIVNDYINVQTNHYYNQNTMNGSTTTPGNPTGPDAGGPGSGGGGTVPGDDDGDGNCEIGEDCFNNVPGDDDNDGVCEPGEACDEEEEEQPSGECEEGEDCSANFSVLDDVPGFAESVASFQTRVAASQIATSINNLGAVIPSGGACPTSSFNALGTSFTIDAHCQLAQQFGGVIRGFFLAMFALVAIIVFFKA
ncbi:MAG: hypothetical protein ACT4QA_07035 [Panacagrimonas sp.]